jgi:predicted RNase H-like HicB family nuclease
LLCCAAKACREFTPSRIYPFGYNFLTLLIKEPAMNQKPLFVHADWDDEAYVWVATSDDVPGLATEAETAEELVEKLKRLIPELLEANGLVLPGGDEGVSFELLTRRFEQARAASRAA